MQLARHELSVPDSLIGRHITSYMPLFSSKDLACTLLKIKDKVMIPRITVRSQSSNFQLSGLPPALKPQRAEEYSEQIRKNRGRYRERDAGFVAPNCGESCSDLRPHVSNVPH